MPLSARIAAAILTVLAASGRAAEAPSSSRSREALALCLRTDRAPEGEKLALYERALALAEEAIRADDGDAIAHFAVFCNLGRLTEMAGVSLGSVAAVRRMRRAIDRTLELAPEYPDGQIAKGSFLMRLPRFFGGDRAEGERLLRRAIAARPEWVEPRVQLALGLAANDAREQALVEARMAVAVAERAGDSDGVEVTRRLIAKLGP
jgi:hypothetical protein